MSGKKAKAARKQAHPSAPPARANSRARGFSTSWKGGFVAFAVVAIVAGSFVLPGLFSKSTPSAGATHAMAMGAKQGEGLPAGARVPAFRERDLLSGKTISAQNVYAHKTLLFFSEGVMCQACFEQIQGLQQVGAQLAKR